MVRQVLKGNNQMEAKQCGFRIKAASKTWGQPWLLPGEINWRRFASETETKEMNGADRRKRKKLFVSVALLNQELANLRGDCWGLGMGLPQDWQCS
jgi:hypothetical protein